jgi:drug/metabolite transporter (DMT)-like permease
MRDLITPGNAKLMTVIAMTLFGTLGLFSRFVDLPASVIVISRGFLGAGFLLVIVYILRDRLSRDDIASNLFTLVLSGACLGANWLFLFEAYKSIEISIATVLNYMTPVIIILISPLVFKTRITPVKLVCALVAIVGLVLVTGILDGKSLEANSYGLTCGIMAAVFYTGLIVFNKKLKSIGAFDRTFMQLLIAAIVVLVYSLFTVDYDSLTLDAQTAVLLLVMALFPTAIAFTLYFGSLAYLDASTSAIYTYIEPVLGIILGVVFLGEDLGVFGWIGAALILGSTLMCELLEQRKAKMAEETEGHP